MEDKDINNLKEIVDLCEKEIKNNNYNATAILDITDLKSLNNLLNELGRLKKENEELKENLMLANFDKKVFYTKALELQKENEKLKTLANKTQWISPCYVSENYISKQKVIDKIKKLKNEFDFYAGREHAEWQDGEFDGEVCDDLALQIKVLKELLNKGE